MKTVIRHIGGAGLLVVVLAATCLGNAAQAEGDAQTLEDLVAQATTAKGWAYFEVKQRILEQPRVAERLAELLKRPDASLERRVVLKAAMEETLQPVGYDLAASELFLGVSHALMPRNIDIIDPTRPAWLGFLGEDPRDLPRASESSRLLRLVSIFPGLLGEVILKHTGQTIAKTRAAVHLGLPYAPAAALVSRDLGAIYRAIRRLALEKAFAPGGSGWFVPRNLRCIGTDAAKEALQRLGTKDALKALEELEAAEKEKEKATAE